MAGWPPDTRVGWIPRGIPRLTTRWGDLGVVSVYPTYHVHVLGHRWRVDSAGGANWQNRRPADPAEGRGVHCRFPGKMVHSTHFVWGRI